MKIFIREILLSIIMSIILIFIISLIITFTSVKENMIMPLVIGACSFSLLICSFRFTKNKKEKGILYGGCLGIMYMIVLYIISSLLSFNFSLSLNSLIMITLGIICGAIGGILGVNF